ncbi:MAG: class I SAM-dependent methyltransferase [Promethearchaeia archaeon]
MIAGTTKFGFRSITYRSGFVYNWLTKRLFDQKRKFLSISKIIGKGKNVLDIACGTGMLAKFLHQSNVYYGIDLNHRFLKKIKKDWKRGKLKPKKIVLKHSNIFDFENYPRKKYDVIVLSDILHHIPDKQELLIENVKRKANKIIICEPIAVKPTELKPKDKFFRIVMYFGRFFPEPLLRILDFIFFDNDGINPYEKRSEWIQTEESIKNMFKKFGITRIYRIFNEYIGIWENNGYDRK